MCAGSAGGATPPSLNLETRKHHHPKPSCDLPVPSCPNYSSGLVFGIWKEKNSAGTPRMTALGVLLLAVAVPLVPTSPVSMQCTLGHEKSGSGTTANWPTYHFMNNVTRTASGTLLLEPLNDANAIAEYRGIYHVMMQVS